MARNAVMLEETKDTITVPAAFMIRMLACIHSLRTRRSAAPADPPPPPSNRNSSPPEPPRASSSQATGERPQSADRHNDEHDETT